jgi:hypothetical protein
MVLCGCASLAAALITLVVVRPDASRRAAGVAASEPATV